MILQAVEHVSEPTVASEHGERVLVQGHHHGSGEPARLHQRASSRSAFTGAQQGELFIDLALGPAGQMVASSGPRIDEVDPATAVVTELCSRVPNLGGNGLAFLADGSLVGA